MTAALLGYDDEEDEGEEAGENGDGERRTKDLLLERDALRRALKEANQVGFRLSCDFNLLPVN